MASLSHQSAVNLNKNFWLAAAPGHSTSSQFVETAGGSVMDYNADILFATMPGNVSTARILGTSGALFIESPNQPINFSQFGDGVARSQINPDSTAQNQYPGIYTSTVVYGAGGLATGGLSNTPLQMMHTDTNNNPLDYYKFYMPQFDLSYGSSIGFLNYSSKDNFGYNVVTSPVYNINPYASPEPTITIPTYTLSTTSVNVDSALISSVNGTQMVANATLINLAKPAFASPQTIPQAVTDIATVTPIPALVPGGIYSYDVPISLSGITANNAGSAPTYPYNVNFGVRIGGIDGTFDYAYTVSLPSAGGIGNGNFEFNLSGMVQAGTQAQTLEVVAFQQQVGTTATLTFVVGNDDRIYLQRVG